MNTYPKRIYGYSLPNCYPSYEECDKESLQKLFQKFRLNKEGEIIQDIDSIHYLDPYLLKVHLIEEEIEQIVEGKEISKTPENFQKIIEYKQQTKLLPYHSVYPIKYKYTEEDYQGIQRISDTDSRLLKFLQSWNSEEINMIEIYDLIKKLPKSLSEPTSPPLDPEKLNRVHSEIVQEYIQGIIESDRTKLTKIKDAIEPIFSEYIKTYKENLTNISQFIAKSDNISKDQKRRFEKIFSADTTKKLKFNPDTIRTILNQFMNSSLDYNDLVLYIQDIQNIIVQLNRNPENLTEGTLLPNNIPKEWKLSPTIEANFKRFYERDDTDGIKHKSYLLLHNRIFTQPLNDSYPGFNNYKNLSQHSHIHLESLYQYLSKYFENLELLQGDDSSVFNGKYSSIYLKFHFIQILNKIYEYIEGLKNNQLDVVNDAMPLYRLLDEQNESLLEESILVCTSFFMDLITHMLLQHYDATWLFLNKEEFDLKNRLSKQRESEKQKIVEKYHNVSPEERMLLKNQQETGQTNQFKEASETYGKYVNSEEYALSTETQRSEKIQEIFSGTLEYEDVDDMNDFQLPNIIPENELQEEEGYYDENDFDENQEEFLVGLDQEQDMDFNE